LKLTAETAGSEATGRANLVDISAAFPGNTCQTTPNDTSAVVAKKYPRIAMKDASLHEIAERGTDRAPIR
jgi:hypothetical protein